jgi:hypothetical protein
LVPLKQRLEKPLCSQALRRLSLAALASSVVVVDLFMPQPVPWLSPLLIMALVFSVYQLELTSW